MEGVLHRHQSGWEKRGVLYRQDRGCEGEVNQIKEKRDERKW